jgi:hypothetical protein
MRPHIAFGTVLLISCLALAGIGIYEVAHFSRASLPLGFTVQIGDALYLDAVAGIVASITATIALMTSATRAGPITAAVVIVLAAIAILPSLSLLTDSIREWTSGASNIDFLPVCSDDTVSDKDAAISTTTDLGLPVTTDASRIAAFPEGTLHTPGAIRHLSDLAQDCRSVRPWSSSRIRFDHCRPCRVTVRSPEPDTWDLSVSSGWLCPHRRRALIRQRFGALSTSSTPVNE